jgi:hypothetical protein
MWILPLLAALAATPTAAPIALPAEIKVTLDQEYPGWKLAPVTPAILQAFRKHKATKLPSLTLADFNSDGKKDYAVQIALTTIGQEEQIVIAFIAGELGYTEMILQSMGLDPNTYLWVQTKAIPDIGPDAQETTTKKIILRVLGSPAGDTAYSFNELKFVEIDLRESPDSPDPSVPRVVQSL